MARNNDIVDKEQYDDFDISEEMYNEIELDNDIIDALEEEDKIVGFDSNCLSQKLSQLSTSNQRQQKNGQRLDKTSRYLSNKNERLKKLINEVLSTVMTTTTASSIPVHNEEDLRQITSLTHKIRSEQIFQSLWITYWKSGMGQLIENQIGPTIWPVIVKTMAKQAINAGASENDACMSLVHDRLRQFNHKIQNHQTELGLLKSRLPNDHRETVYQTIETLIVQKLENLRQKIEHKITLVQYDYKDRALELEFFQQNPSDHCIKLYKHLYDVRYKQDVTREEVQLVKQRIYHYNNSPRSKLQISHPRFITTISNQDFQQQLNNQLTNAVEQAKNDILNLYVKTAETQMEHYGKQYYDKELDKIFVGRKSLPVDQQLTTIMVNLLEERADNRKERIKYVNQFKIHCLHSNSNH
ncbi:unnamed protein product [Adineta steineri]|uniref:Uncharacterized protein n=1 Tax=Adineta steineri TaxID=433720 RepID=A0A815I758_9BILA|nr:unnamed protein product [Adineta steineri]CAF1601410.1 unnamed protein product [Adineta steineri]